MRYILLPLLFLLTATPSIQAQDNILHSKVYKISWKQADSLYMPGHEILRRLYFDEARYDSDLHHIPWYYTTFNVVDKALQLDIELSVIETEPLPYGEFELLGSFVPDTMFKAKYMIGQAREEYIAGVSVMPLRLNPESGAIERLLRFRLEVGTDDAPFVMRQDEVNYTDNSVLATGNWYKFRTGQTGIHRISYNELQQMGVNVTSINPRNIRIYGNGGGILPEENDAVRHDDLVENPIVVVGESDGSFDPNDYILFYARGPVTWDLNPASGFFEHQNNYYEDSTYFFLTTDMGPGKRVQPQNAPAGELTNVVTEFLDYQLHEQDLINLINMGRTWYGEVFDLNLTQDFNFQFPDIITSKEGRVVSEAASRNHNPASFQWHVDDELMAVVNLTPSTSTYEYARLANAGFQFSPGGSNVKVTVRYNRTAGSSRGWLDYISVNAWRQLKFHGPQLVFSNPESTGIQKINEYQLNPAGAQLTIWDVTDPVHAQLVETSQSGTNRVWRADGHILRKYIAFDGSSYYPIEFVGQVANQNLHSVRNIDYLIISPDEFIEEAERLANVHRNHSGMEVYVTTPKLIYNEFSSGGQDITAIRDFVRMLYQTSDPGRQIKYLLLFGDASFDYKDRIGGNTNFVPTWQTDLSLHIVLSIATDDYFGYLDDGEGGSASSLLDIGIGRFPVSSLRQARQMVDKVIHYLRKDENTMGPWRNYLTFVADDGDSNHHLNDAENLSGLIQNTRPIMNIDKIYLDAYPQIATPGGQKAPEVNQAINRRMEKGTLIMNYSGHGGEVGWASERILEIADIQSWRNINMLPVFITATCEFSRYDDPERTSAGEMVFLNPNGGAIAMFTTARATYASLNLVLNRAVFNNNMFHRENGEYPRFGDVIRKAKSRGDANDRKFVLLGDPALRLAYPTERVVTTHINGKDVGQRSDTIRALDMVSIGGKVTNDQGVLLNDFNGVVYVTVFDKEREIETKGDENGFPQTFTLQNSIIYQGLASVVNGYFEFSFIVPKDIAYNFGHGRISYYATNYDIDGHGYFDGFIVGGFNENAVADENGPEIRLFMNDTTFKSGDTTDERPILLAFVSDESGINTTGSGIGHDIVATITGETNLSAVLNDYYRSDLDKNNSGSIAYPFYSLNEGLHHLRLKVWDVFNNSSEASIEFVVVNSGQMALDHLMNYPNPFRNETYFVFDHNQAGRELEVQIQIFNMSGNLVRTIREEMKPGGYRSTPIRWDGSTEGGYPISKGMYVYRLIVTNELGEQDELRSKLVFHR